jgi:hypothetical protein
MPTENEEINELFRRVRDEWDSAEKNVKAAEQAVKKPVVPAINELRYAGRKLVDALHAFSNGRDVEAAKEHLGHALYSCHCAKHDAIDVCVSVMIAHIDTAKNRYGFNTILAAFPQLTEMLACMDDVNEKIQASRLDRGDREKIYASITNENIPRLEEYYKKFKSAEKVFSSVNWGKRMGWLVPVVVAIIAAGVAIGIGIYNHPKQPAANSPSIDATPDAP